jgi:hypothetical protein
MGGFEGASGKERRDRPEANIKIIVGREGRKSGGHKEASGHGFPAESREERADARADFLAGEIGVPEDFFPGSPASIPVSVGRIPKISPSEGIVHKRTFGGRLRRLPLEGTHEVP